VKTYLNEILSNNAEQQLRFLSRRSGALARELDIASKKEAALHTFWYQTSCIESTVNMLLDRSDLNKKYAEGAHQRGLVRGLFIGASFVLIVLLPFVHI
jgi:hypothetical protein